MSAWQKSDSLADVARALKCNTTGGGYRTIKSTARELGLSDSHMTKHKNSIKAANGRRQPYDEILIENSPYKNSNALKHRLWADDLLRKECYICGIDEWLGKPAPLALDHINGINTDHRLDNLRVLCYNCHGQTETYGSKNLVYQKSANTSLV